MSIQNSQQVISKIHSDLGMIGGNVHSYIMRLEEEILALTQKNKELEAKCGISAQKIPDAAATLNDEFDV